MEYARSLVRTVSHTVDLLHTLWILAAGALALAGFAGRLDRWPGE